MHVQYILALQKLQQNPTQAKDLSFHNTHLTWGVCELIEKNFSMHVRTTAGVSFTTACTATPTRHAHRASVATYMQQQHQHQQQAASSATCYGACQEDLSTCGFLHNMYCMYLLPTEKRASSSSSSISTSPAHGGGGGALRAYVGLEVKKVHVTNVTAPLPTYYLTPISHLAAKRRQMNR